MTGTTIATTNIPAHTSSFRRRNLLLSALSASSSSSSSSRNKTQPKNMMEDVHNNNNNDDDDSESSMEYDHFVAVCQSDKLNDTRLTCYKSTKSSVFDSNRRSITKDDTFMKEEPGSSRTLLLADSTDTFLIEDVSCCSITADEGDETTTTTNDYDVSEKTTVTAEPAAPVVSTTVPETISNTAAATESSSKKKKKKKTVSWSDISIYEHELMLGDNPSVSSGPPICCGGKLLQRQTLTIHDYEENRPLQSRRKKAQLAVPRLDREDWLIRAGYGRADMRQAVDEVQRIKKLRDKSAKGNVLERFSKSSSRYWYWPSLSSSQTTRKTRLLNVDESPATI